MRKGFRPGVIALLILAVAAPASAKPYGLESRSKTRAYLAMPDRGDAAMPLLLSQTGAFKSVRDLSVSDGLIPYDLIVPFWSDGAVKSRWVAVPNAKIKFAPTGEWIFPNGTVFVKTFELATNETNPSAKRRLETRLIVRDGNGGVYGVTYKWRPDNSDADLLVTNLSEAIAIKTASGVRTQMWYYPSRQDCLLCHTANAGLVLGVKTRQLNRDLLYPSGVKDNELRTWNHLGLFDTNLNETTLDSLPKLVSAHDASRSVEDRARSYLDANCAQCHRPKGTVAYFDARYDTPLAKQGLIDGPVLIDQRIDNPRVVAPNDIWRSILYMRADSVEPLKMPPLAHNRVDEEGMKLLRGWIEGLPGPPVLPPPKILPAGGNYDKPMEVTFETEPGAVIRYTLDGSVPTSSDALYEKPVRLTGPAIVRAKAFKDGFTKSITSQEIFIVNSAVN
jgi:uncharacterized repeat protein (TIGR03806 family)